MSQSKPKVYITESAWDDIRRYVSVSKLEISMLGEVEVKDETFVITKIHLPTQTRYSAFTKITHDGVMEILTNPEIDASKVKCWIHSHVYMNPTPSSTDEKQAKELMEDAEWFIRIIVNKKDNYTCFIHWMGIDIEAELVILTENKWNIEETEKEIESKTVHEVTIITPSTKKKKAEKTVTYGDHRRKCNFKKYDDDNDSEQLSWYDNHYGERNYRKLSYEEHVAWNPYITNDMHANYTTFPDAPSFPMFLEALNCDIDKLNTSEKEIDASIAYEEFLLELQYDTYNSLKERIINKITFNKSGNIEDVWQILRNIQNDDEEESLIKNKEQNNGK